MNNFYRDFVAGEEDDEADIPKEEDNYFTPVTSEVEEDNIPYQDDSSNLSDMNNTYSDENQKNLDEFNMIMARSHKKDNNLIDRNSPGMKIFMIIFWIVVIGVLAYCIYWLIMG